LAQGSIDSRQQRLPLQLGVYRVALETAPGVQIRKQARRIFMKVEK
jgi:hypothetical protein